MKRKKSLSFLGNILLDWQSYKSTSLIYTNHIMKLTLVITDKALCHFAYQTIFLPLSGGEAGHG
jgi:hypothetical protein